jgi:PIN domain
MTNVSRQDEVAETIQDDLADPVRTCVVLDTNQWDRMPMLRHQLAAALLFALQRRPDVFIGLPSVVHDEVVLHLAEKRRDAEEKLTRAAGEIRQIFGKAQQVDSHTDQDVRDALSERLIELGPLVEVLAATDDDLIEAGRMVLACQPPSARKDQQYKDSVIWRIVARTARDHHVAFVTSDEGFYASKNGPDLERGLAEEVSAVGGSVTLYRKVEDLLAAWWADQPSRATDEVREVVAQAVANQLDGWLREQGKALAVSDVETIEIEAYLTERHNELAVSGQFRFFLTRTEEPRGFRHSHRAEVQATASVRILAPTALEVLDIAFDSIAVETLTAEGAETSRSAFVRGVAAVAGRRFERFRLQVPLDTPREAGDR